MEAKIIEADPVAHQARLDEARQRRYVSLSRVDAVGLRHVVARVGAGDAAYVDAVVARVAELLAARPEHADDSTDPDEPAERQVPRAMAFPADLLEALRALRPGELRPRVVLYVHLHEAALSGTPAVARVEGIGPCALAQLRELLAHTHVTIKPVIDLADRVSSMAYEHPESIRERIHLTHLGDVFPHATRTSRQVDLDHPVPYDPLGPPGQTSSHTGRPLSRTPHRAKTHLGYQITTLPTGETLCRTPHGLIRLVDHDGTHAPAS